MARPLLLTAPLLLPTGSRVAQQLPGSLQGTVIDAAGKAVGNAIVYALPEQGRQIRTTTDPQGKFVFKALPEGVIYLDAFRKNDGFPFNFFAFLNYSSHTISKVEVKAGSVVSDIIINLLPKTARIAISLTDQSGTPVKGVMTLSFTRDDMPDAYRQSASAPHSVLVPIVPFSFSVQVAGYLPWSSERITLQPGEMLDIAVKLQGSSLTSPAASP